MISHQFSDCQHTYCVRNHIAKRTKVFRCRILTTDRQLVALVNEQDATTRLGYLLSRLERCGSGGGGGGGDGCDCDDGVCASS